MAGSILDPWISCIRRLWVIFESVQDAIIYIDPDNPVNLQNQIRQKIVDGIVNGAFPPGMKLPSSRKLARQLEVARNTVVASYQQLIADGYLVSRQRSGIFVSEEILKT